MWDVLPLVAFYSSHSKNSEILLVHLLGCNDHNTFMRLTWVIHVSFQKNIHDVLCDIVVF